MDFYGRIIDTQGNPSRPIIFINERGTDIVRRIDLIDIHFSEKINGYLDILANGNLLTANEPEIIEIFVILEIHCPAPVNNTNLLSSENLIGKEVFVHSRF